jgi:hypothetical protein
MCSTLQIKLTCKWIHWAGPNKLQYRILIDKGTKLRTVQLTEERKSGLNRDNTNIYNTGDSASLQCMVLEFRTQEITAHMCSVQYRTQEKMHTHTYIVLIYLTEVLYLTPYRTHEKGFDMARRTVRSAFRMS